MWTIDTEDGPWMACTTALPQAAAYSSLYTNIWSRHDGKKVRTALADCFLAYVIFIPFIASLELTFRYTVTLFKILFNFVNASDDNRCFRQCGNS